jgi:hypothetical protein
MQPAFADGYFLSADWAAGRDEVECGHTSGCSGITLIEQLTGAAALKCRRGFAPVLANMQFGCDAHACSLRSLTPRMRVCVAGASLFLVSGLRDWNLLDLLAKAAIGRAATRMTKN